MSTVLLVFLLCINAGGAIWPSSTGSQGRLPALAAGVVLAILARRAGEFIDGGRLEPRR
jgi:hypothetical protein